MDFSCALAVGNVDRARKFVAAAVRPRPALWESAARAFVAAGRADVAGLCLSRAGHARGAAAVREAAAEADGDDDDTIGPPRAAPSETCCRCWCRPTWTRRTTGRASTPLRRGSRTDARRSTSSDVSTRTIAWWRRSRASTSAASRSDPSRGQRRDRRRR